MASRRHGAASLLEHEPAPAAGLNVPDPDDYPIAADDDDDDDAENREPPTPNDPQMAVRWTQEAADAAADTKSTFSRYDNDPLPLPDPIHESQLRAPSSSAADELCSHFQASRVVFVGTRDVAFGQAHDERMLGAVTFVDGHTGCDIWGSVVTPRQHVESVLAPITGISLRDLTERSTPAMMVRHAVDHSAPGTLGPDVLLIGARIQRVVTELCFVPGQHFGALMDFEAEFAYRDPLFFSHAYFDISHLATVEGLLNNGPTTAEEEALVVRWLALKYLPPSAGEEKRKFIVRALRTAARPTRQEMLSDRCDGVCLSPLVQLCTCKHGALQERRQRSFESLAQSFLAREVARNDRPPGPQQHQPQHQVHGHGQQQQQPGLQFPGRGRTFEPANRGGVSRGRSAGQAPPPPAAKFMSLSDAFGPSPGSPPAGAAAASSGVPAPPRPIDDEDDGAAVAAPARGRSYHADPAAAASGARARSQPTASGHGFGGTYNLNAAPYTPGAPGGWQPQQQQQHHHQQQPQQHYAPYGEQQQHQQYHGHQHQQHQQKQYGAPPFRGDRFPHAGGGGVPAQRQDFYAQQMQAQQQRTWAHRQENPHNGPSGRPGDALYGPSAHVHVHLQPQGGDAFLGPRGSRRDVPRGGKPGRGSGGRGHVSSMQAEVNRRIQEREDKLGESAALPRSVRTSSPQGFTGKRGAVRGVPAGVTQLFARNAGREAAANAQQQQQQQQRGAAPPPQLDSQTTFRTFFATDDDSIFGSGGVGGDDDPLGSGYTAAVSGDAGRTAGTVWSEEARRRRQQQLEDTGHWTADEDE